MKIYYKLVGYLRLQIELDTYEGQLELNTEATVEEALHAIGIKGKPAMMLLVNKQLANRDTVLHEGANLRLVPIVGGG